MARPTLVLLPGLLNTRRVFEPVIAELGDAADVIVPELYSYDSMGGYVCFEILRRAAARVERLALIDTQAAPDRPETTARRRGFIEQSTLGRFHGVQPSLLPSLVHPSQLANPDVVEPILEMGRHIGPDGFVREQRAIMARPDSRPLLVDIKVPTLVITGRQDQSVPLARAQEMAADIADARLVVLENCGHMAPLEKPAEVAAALRRWLSQ